MKNLILLLFELQCYSYMKAASLDICVALLMVHCLISHSVLYDGLDHSLKGNRLEGGKPVRPTNLLEEKPPKRYTTLGFLSAVSDIGASRRQQIEPEGGEQSCKRS